MAAKSSKETSNSFLVERRTLIAADPAAVHKLIDNLHEWRRWSPWEDVDPEMARTYSGPESGVGASYAWRGNRKAGEGSMTITESEPGAKVVLDLGFLKPFKARNVVTFLLEPRDDGTMVRWQLTGRRTLFFTVFGFIISMDKIVGKDFERGLARLEAVAEQS